MIIVGKLFYGYIVEIISSQYFLVLSVPPWFPLGA